jgi:hypothetical protein
MSVITVSEKLQYFNLTKLNRNTCDITAKLQFKDIYIYIYIYCLRLQIP